ncbi:MAG: TetR/AcrR family transcriptional regulator [Candidatus Dormibacteria bacterium]
MSVAQPLRDRRAERYAATRREILDAAWELVRVGGLASLAMRDLGARVGMRAQSIYVYFTSKDAIYDAMFAESNVELLNRVTAIPATNDPVHRVRLISRVFLDFAVEDPVRYQLLFQRSIPKFEPSQEAFAPALRILDIGRTAMRDCGISSDRAFDTWTALTAGLAAQQNSNQPGGDRWVRLADDVADMYFAHHRPATGRRTP